MSVKMKEWGYTTPKQILAIPDHYVAIAYKHARAVEGSTGNAVLENGRYIVKAGTIYPSNDSSAIGVVLNDYDVTDGDKQIAVVVHGYIQTSKLPVAPTDNAVSALKDIQFLPIGATVAVTAEADEVEVATGETDAITDKAVIALTNGRFRDAATTLSNWTISGESTVKITVKAVTLSDDKTKAFIEFNTPSAAAVGGSITMLASKSIIDVNKTYANAVAVLTVA